MLPKVISTSDERPRKAALHWAVFFFLMLQSNNKKAAQKQGPVNAAAITLSTPLLEALPRLMPEQKEGLQRLGMVTVRDLLYHFPVRYGDTATFTSVDTLTKGSKAIVFGTLSGLKSSKGFRTKIPMSQATITTDTWRIHAVWFHQPYIAKMLTDGALVRAEGPVSERRKTGELYLSNPKIEAVASVPTGTADSLFKDAALDEASAAAAHILYPVYPETRGITSHWIYHRIRKLFAVPGFIESLDADDPLPPHVREAFHLPSLGSAMIYVHEPQRNEDAAAARKRFAFEEMLCIQIINEKARRKVKAMPSYPVDGHAKELARTFLDHLPYRATAGQEKAIADVLVDFAAGEPMCRLLEGDVGSGKTLVAAAASYAVISTRPPGRNASTLQVAYMCPTEILAAQHFTSFISYFGEAGMAAGINIALITGSGCQKFPSKIRAADGSLKPTDISRAQLSKWVANGEISIVIGTHALIQKWVQFKHLALVIIDEQHRFGTAQRAALLRKENAEERGISKKSASTVPTVAPNTAAASTVAPIPHLLTMSATPIPRTLMLTIFGDLDLSVLSDLPVGRKKPITEIVLPRDKEREAVYERLRIELSHGRQVYIICPRIDEPDPEKEMALEARSVVAEAKRLKKEVFPDYEIAVLHGKMNPAKKDEAMAAFASGRAHILCATSVVEVGVNVPNATVMVIEGGERFGLAQLHQLRGRIMRSSHQPYCFVFAEQTNEKTAKRLGALTHAADGFALAEYDLTFRGPGELYGGKQWGLSDLAMEALKNPKLVEAARSTAKEMLNESPDLSIHAPLAAIIKEKEKSAVHFE